MDTWKIFGEALLPKKKDFYSSINIETSQALIIGM